MYLGRLTYMDMLIYIWTSNSPNELRNVAPKGGPFRCLDLRHNDDGSILGANRYLTQK